MSGVITCSFLANQRFGNALFIYCFCRAYAEKMGVELQTPAWIGQKIFENVNEKPITVRCQPTWLDSRMVKPVGYWFGATGIDVQCYCQHQKYLDYYTRAQVKQWLKLKPEYESYAPMFSYQYSAAHLRRGDMVENPALKRLYCEVSRESYDKAINQFNIPEPVYYVQDGWKSPPQELSEKGVPWLSDWLMIRNATHLLRANSTFSVFASWCGNGKTYSPVVEDKAGLQDCYFVEGNWPCTAGKFQNQSNLNLRES